MAAIHQRLSIVIVLLALVGVIWSAYRARHRLAGGRLLWYGWAIVAGLLLQGVLGAWLALSGGRPADGSHFVVGPLALLALPVAQRAAGGRPPRAGSLIVLAGWVVTLALSLRALGTGGLGG